MTTTYRIAYLCLQATTEGQASHAHVHEIIAGLEEIGHTVELFEPDYVGATSPGIIARLREFRRVNRRLIRRLRDFDAVYIRAHAFTLATAKAARKRRIPVITECNGHYNDFFTAWPAAEPLRARISSMMRWQYRHTDGLIAVSPILAEWLAAEAKRTDVVVIANGANTDLFTPEASPMPNLPTPCVVFFGALAPWQGIAEMLEALDCPEWPSHVSLVVAGDGALRWMIEDTIAAGETRLHYAGRLPYHQIPHLINASLAGLSPKNDTGDAAHYASPVKPFEILSCGKPVIVTDFPGQADFVRANHCGLVIPPNDPAALARAVAAVAQDPDGASIMGRAGRVAILREASWTIRARQTARVIDQAIQPRE